MGVDIHMSILNPNGEYVEKEIWEGRNSEWFDNLCKRGDSEVYSNFPAIPIYSDFPIAVPADIVNDKESGCYGFYYLTVRDFLTWFDHMRPDIDAGWCSTYEKWLYEHKHIIPEYSHWISAEEKNGDYCFVEFRNEYESSAILYNYLQKHEVSGEDILIYYFDC